MSGKEVLEHINSKKDDRIDSQELIDALQPKGILQVIDEEEKEALQKELNTTALNGLSNSFLKEFKTAYSRASHRKSSNSASSLDETIIKSYSSLQNSPIRSKIDAIVVDPFEKHKTTLSTIDSKKDTMISWEEMKAYLTPTNASDVLKQFKEVFKDPYEFHGHRLDRLRQSYNALRMDINTEKLSLKKEDILLFQFCTNLFQPLTDMNIPEDPKDREKNKKKLTMDGNLKTLYKEIQNTSLSQVAAVGEKPRTKKEKKEAKEASLEQLAFQEKAMHLGLDCLVSLYHCQLQVLQASNIEKKDGKRVYPTGNIGLNMLPNECYVVDALARQIQRIGGGLQNYKQQKATTSEDRMTKWQKGNTLIAHIGNLQHDGTENIFSSIQGYNHNTPLERYTTRTGVSFFGLSNHALAELGRVYRTEKDDRTITDTTGKTKQAIIYGGDHQLAEIKGLFSEHLRSLMGNNTVIGGLWQMRSDEKDIAGSLGSFEDSEFFEGIQGIKESKLRKDSTRTTQSPDKEFYPYIHTLVFSKNGALAQAAQNAESKTPHSKIDITSISHALNVQIGMLQDPAMRARLTDYFKSDGLWLQLKKDIDAELKEQSKTLDTIAMNTTLAEIAGSHPEQLLSIATEQGLAQSNALRTFLQDEHITAGPYNDQATAFLKDPRGIAVNAGKIGEFVDFLCHYCQQFPNASLASKVAQKSQSMQADYYNTAMVTRFGTEVVNATLQANPSVTEKYSKKEAALRLYADITGTPGGGRSDKNIKRTESTSKLILQQVVIFALSGGVGSMASGILRGTKAAGRAINAARLITNGSVFHISASVLQNMLVAKSLGERGTLNHAALTDIHGYIKSIAFIKVNSIFAGISGKIAGNIANTILRQGLLVTGEIASMMATERTLGVLFGEKCLTDAFTRDDLVNAVGITLGLKLAHKIMPNQQVIIDSVIRDGNGKVIDITASIIAGGKKIGTLIKGKIKTIQEKIKTKKESKESGQGGDKEYKKSSLSPETQAAMHRIRELHPTLHDHLQTLLENHSDTAHQELIASTARSIADRLQSVTPELQATIASKIIEALRAEHPSVEHKMDDVSRVLTEHENTNLSPNFPNEDISTTVLIDKLSDRGNATFSVILTHDKIDQIIAPALRDTMHQLLDKNIPTMDSGYYGGGNLGIEINRLSTENKAIIEGLRNDPHSGLEITINEEWGCYFIVFGAKDTHTLYKQSLALAERLQSQSYQSLWAFDIYDFISKNPEQDIIQLLEHGTIYIDRSTNKIYTRQPEGEYKKETGNPLNKEKQLQSLEIAKIKRVEQLGYTTTSEGYQKTEEFTLTIESVAYDITLTTTIHFTENKTTTISYTLLGEKNIVSRPDVIEAIEGQIHDNINNLLLKSVPKIDPSSTFRFSPDNKASENTPGKAEQKQSLHYRQKDIEEVAEKCGDHPDALDIHDKLKDLAENKESTETFESIKQEFDVFRATFEANRTDPAFASTHQRLDIAKQALVENGLIAADVSFTPTQQKAIIWAHLQPGNITTGKILMDAAQGNFSREQAQALMDNKVCAVFGNFFNSKSALESLPKDQAKEIDIHSGLELGTTDKVTFIKVGNNLSVSANGQTISMTPGTEVVLGRENTNLNFSTKVSRKHCTLWYGANGKLYVTEHGTTNGTKAQPAVIEQPRPIEVQQKTEVSKHHHLFERNTQQREALEIQRKSEVSAIGDLHGDYKAFVDNLTATGNVDGAGKRIGGNNVVVFHGDILADRTPEGLKILEHINTLRKSANEQGGDIVVLAGNHDDFMISFLTNRGGVHRDGIDISKPHGQGKGLRELERFGKVERGNQAAVLASMRNSPEGRIILEEICNMELAQQIDDTLYLHTDPTPEILSYIVDTNKKQTNIGEKVDQINHYRKQGLRQMLLGESNGVNISTFNQMADTFLDTGNRAASTNQAQYIALKQSGINRIMHGHSGGSGSKGNYFGVEIIDNDHSYGKGSSNYHGNKSFSKLGKNGQVQISDR